MEFYNDKLVLAYTGSEISATILKEYLAESDIHSTIKNEKNSSLSAGFGTASKCEVYIFEHDVEKAKPLLEEFAKTDEE
ncbi:MAG: hypothetical protein COX70_01970 [Flavobacteriales bacterium CG_4_10_14_0_2_um_filter_32_8]|nr:MAG: hypothetical protein COX70_01970 [Flavobacteriales bacterium CG_4_10_14_0_2_um_filter_32_8]PJB14327.1 MAG: hypothetical protein CO118_09175 [Flavobacteriales bacterium CG_4_9_14_3_um_filter_32_8]